MTLHRIWSISTLGGLAVVANLGLIGSSSWSWAKSLPEIDASFLEQLKDVNLEADELPRTSQAQSSPALDSSFLEWLNTPPNPDAEETPRTSRGGSEFCFVALDQETVTPLWSDRPVFLIQGGVRNLILHQVDNEEPIWTHSASDTEAITYDGPPLQPGIVYVLRAEHPVFSNDIFVTRQLTLLSVEDQVEIATTLSDLETELQGAGQSEAAIALARADYFWQQELTVDAWAAVLPLQPTSETVSEAIATAYERICS